MIIGDPRTFGIHLDVVQFSADKTWIYGAFNFIIDDQFIPGKGSFYTLNSVPATLQSGLDFFEGQLNLGGLDIERIDFDNPDLYADKNSTLVSLQIGEVGDDGLIMVMGLDGDVERLFYTVDFGKNWKERKYPRGTIYKVIMQLPTIEEIRDMID